jgi:drug/metabolite transporter (DMT)-like permease
VQVGAAIVASRFVVAEVPPLTLAMLRYAIGFLCLLPFALPLLAAVRAQLRPRDLAAMAALGIGQFGILIALLNWGLQTVPAAPAAMIFSLFPCSRCCSARRWGASTSARGWPRACSFPSRA